MYSVQGIFQHHFQCKKVHTILDKIWYFYRQPSYILGEIFTGELQFQICRANDPLRPYKNQIEVLINLTAKLRYF